jgi:hypothetical protein
LNKQKDTIKKLIILSIILFSCQIATIQDDWNSFKFDKVKLNSIEEVQAWVSDKIDPVNDNERYSRDYWKYPSETLDDGEGDCEDMAILIIAIVHYQLGYKCNLVIVTNSINTSHAIISYKGSYYHSTDIGKYDKEFTNTYECEYDEIPYAISTRR